jgi:hypothetical protein
LRLTNRSFGPTLAGDAPTLRQSRRSSLGCWTIPDEPAQGRLVSRIGSGHGQSTVDAASESMHSTRAPCTCSPGSGLLWAAPCPVFVVPMEPGVARSLPFSAQTPGLSIPLPIPAEPRAGLRCFRLGLASQWGRRRSVRLNAPYPQDFFFDTSRSSPVPTPRQPKGSDA